MAEVAEAVAVRAGLPVVFGTQGVEVVDAQA